jgi:DNA-binding phage protein
MGGTLPLTNRSTETPGSTSDLERSVLYHCARAERRAVLQSLADEEQLSLTDLATAVATRIADASTPHCRKPSADHVATSLYHAHLHPLAEAGLIERADDSTVALAGSVDPTVVEDLIRAGDGDWEALEAILGTERRQRVVTALASADGAMPRTRLAETLAAMAGPTTDGPGAVVDSMDVSLHHVDLPALADAGVVTYDVDEENVELASVPDAYRAYATPPGV